MLIIFGIRDFIVYLCTRIRDLHIMKISDNILRTYAGNEN